MPPFSYEMHEMAHLAIGSGAGLVGCRPDVA